MKIQICLFLALISFFSAHCAATGKMAGVGKASGTSWIFKDARGNFNIVNLILSDHAPLVCNWIIQEQCNVNKTKSVFFVDAGRIAAIKYMADCGNQPGIEALAPKEGEGIFFKDRL